MNFTALMPVMGLMGKKISDLVDGDLQALLTVVAPGAVVTDRLKSNVFDILSADNIDSVADVIARPDVLKKLVSAVTTDPNQTTEVVRECKHCGNFNVV